MKKLTIGQVIGMVDELKPNIQTTEQKIIWLDDLDEMFYQDMVLTHENSDGTVFNGYTADEPMNTELLIPAHWGNEIYRYYLECQIDLINKEYAKYNSSSALFNSTYESYCRDYHCKHMPLQPNSIHYGEYNRFNGLLSPLS